ncbi:MAG TPA: hypothetical protein DCM08_04140, partial [Microscillaceae bacterium]|nr:hypothetical protein [Microscillaceae bacterium]
MRPPRRDKKFTQQSSFQKPFKKFKDSIQKATQFDKTKKKFFKTDANATEQQGGQFKKNTFFKEGNSYPKKRYGESSEGQ